MTDNNDTITRPVTAGRGPAYPYFGLQKAVERIEQVHANGLSKLELPPDSFYKAWGYKKENGPARQTLAALNHYGFVTYNGRGKDRTVKLTRLALQILLDKIPDSPERAKAIKTAALSPDSYHALWTRFQGKLVPDFAMETYLTMEKDFAEGPAKKVIEGYRETYDYAGFDESDILPEEAPTDQPEDDAPSFTDHMINELFGQAATPGSKADKGPDQMQTENVTASQPTSPLPMSESSNMKVMLDGELIRVSAVVDLKGAKKLMKALKANIVLLQDEDEEDE